MRVAVNLCFFLTMLPSTVVPATSPPKCDLLETQISKIESSVKVRRHLNGVWISQKCETWPGPQFVLRRYQFRHDFSFRLLRFYYSDPWCRSPIFSLSAVGRFEPFSSITASSWVVPGGLEPDYVIHRIKAVPFVEEKARFLSQKVNLTCPGFSRKRWRLHKKYRILNFNDKHISARFPSEESKEVDCTRELDFSFNELQLLRVERRRILRYYENHTNQRQGDERFTLELHLGAEIPERNTRSTFYKTPLRFLNSDDCPICRLLANATVNFPPRLPPIRHQDPIHLLSGDWISERCEVRPQGLFLKRRLTFSSAHKKWQGEHTYYRDQACRKRMFVLQASGVYYRSGLTVAIPGAADVVFQIKQARLTPEDIHFVSNLNGFQQKGDCTLETKWRLHVPVNLTDTQSCKALGVLIPSVKFDIMKIEKEQHGILHLYIGRDMEDNTKPTSFQPPLIHCDFGKVQNDVENVLHPMPWVQLRNSELSLQHIVKYLYLVISLTVTYYTK